MVELFNLITSVPYANRPPVQDIIAKLHSFVTCNMLIAFAALLSMKQFIGHPVECYSTDISTNKNWFQVYFAIL